MSRVLGILERLVPHEHELSVVSGERLDTQTHCRCRLDTGGLDFDDNAIGFRYNRVRALSTEARTRVRGHLDRVVSPNGYSRNAHCRIGTAVVSAEEQFWYVIGPWELGPCGNARGRSGSNRGVVASSHEIAVLEADPAQTRGGGRRSESAQRASAGERFSDDTNPAT